MDKNQQLRCCLENIRKDYAVVSELWQTINEDFQLRQQKVETLACAERIHKTAIALFSEQCMVLNECIMQSKEPDEQQELIDNFRTIQMKLMDLVEHRKNVKEELSDAAVTYDHLNNQLNHKKSEMQTLKNEERRLLKNIKECNPLEEEKNSEPVRQRSDSANPYRDGCIMPGEVNHRKLYPHHCVEENWFFPQYQREQAATALRNKEMGTFLIRKISRQTRGHVESVDQYVCSLNANGEVHHCLIEKTSDGYGFAEPFNLHQTLTDLVLHYAHNSLIPHNGSLNTTLRIPLRLVLK